MFVLPIGVVAWFNRVVAAEGRALLESNSSAAADGGTGPPVVVVVGLPAGFFMFCLPCEKLIV